MSYSATSFFSSSVSLLPVNALTNVHDWLSHAPVNSSAQSMVGLVSD